MTQNEKKCMIFETLGNVGAMQQITEGVKDGFMRLSGVFGIAGVKNQNNRIYDKANYTAMVESLQKAIVENGCLGELEHPNSMNIDLNNVSHKIESIEMNEDGTVTGTILLLNTPKGKIAQAIVEAGNPLFISSRGAGTITNEGRVTLSSLKTYDLVGTPGFSQAKFTLKENQTVECLNENLEEGNYVYAIVEGNDDDLLDDLEDDKKDDKHKEDDTKEDDKKDDKKTETDEKKDEEDDDEEDDKKDKKEDNNKNNDDIDMNDLKEAIDKLTEKVTSLEAQLHVAQESLEEVKPIDYSSIEQWVKEEFGPDFQETLLNTVNEKIQNAIEESVNGLETKFNDSINENVKSSIDSLSESIQNWVVNEFAPEVQNWVTEEFAPEVQGWITEEFAPEVQNWITEEFAPEVQNWVTEEFAPEIQNWIVEEYTPVVDSWINEEFAPNNSKQIEEKVNANVSAFMESQKAGRLENIDSLLEAISNDNNASVAKIVKEANADDKYKGVYVVENMPDQYKPSWQMLDESKQEEIVRTSRAYDFTKEGVLESFWANVDFNTKKEEPKQSAAASMVNENYYNNIVNQMKLLRKVN